MATTYTSKLNLGKPAQHDPNWHTPVNANFDGLDAKLGPLYENIFVVSDDTYIASNATYVTDHWERQDTSKPATAIKLDKENGKIIFYQCDAGLGTITWTEMGNINSYGLMIPTLTKLTASDTVLFEESGYWDSSSVTDDYTLIKTITIPERFNSGTIRVKNTLQRISNGGTAYIKIVVGSTEYTHNTTSLTPVIFSDDITIDSESTIEIYLKGRYYDDGYRQSARLTHYSVCADDPLTIDWSSA